METESKLVIKSANDVYGRLQDDLSRYIYDNRLLWSCTGDYSFIQNVILTTDEGKAFKDELCKSGNNYIFGSGIWGTHLAKVWKGKFEGFIDNDSQKWGGLNLGLKVFAPDEVFTSSFNGNVWIGTRLYYKEIKKQLIEDYGLTNDQIINVGKTIDNMAVRQYFDLKEMPENESEIFLDVGSLDGLTAVRFFKWANGRGEKAYCFEPDKKNQIKVQKNLSDEIDNGKAEIVPYAALDTRTIIKFKATGNGASMVSDEGISLQASSIDEEIPDADHVTFIKMDIEGSELRAIKGATETIRRNHPKLAISLYHKPEDIFTLADEILGLFHEACIQSANSCWHDIICLFRNICQFLQPT